MLPAIEGICIVKKSVLAEMILSSHD